MPSPFPVHSRLAASFLPRTAVLEMTYRCSHACLFCSCPWYAPGGRFDERTELGTGQWKEVLARLCRMGVTELCFTGGEPLLKEDLLGLVEFAARCRSEHVRSEGEELIVEVKPPHLHLLTNGLAMSEEVLALCKRHQVHLGMSLPGLTTFREHTQRSEPQGVLRWFRRAAEEGVRTHVGITVTRKNLHELYETMAEALLAGAGEVLLNRFMPGGRGLVHARDLMLDADGIRQMLATAEQVLRLANRHGNVGTELPRCLFDASAHTHLKVGSDCAAAIEFFVVDPSGYVRACNHSPERLVPFEQIEALKDHPVWRRFVAREHQPAACAGCALASCCAGGCREAARIWNGQLDSLDPVFEGGCLPKPVPRSG
ncbi:MAG: radical SAM protein [Deltaproteobacteria bacterium]|nr:radical SAM protein [Deltaproteobacteria bacterium]